MPDLVMKDMKDKMDKTISHFRDELKTIRTGRASVAVFDGMTIDYYGTPTPLSGVASLNAPEPRLITIQPWDISIMGVIEKAIQNSNMGFNPSNDGKIIRIPVPQLTEERRKEIVKLVKKMAEDNKVAIRNLRREGNDKIKKLEKDKEISEDDSKKYVADIQDVTNNYIKKVDEVTAVKEKEVMEI
jgi:ribosome recycling factor